MRDECVDTLIADIFAELGGRTGRGLSDLLLIIIEEIREQRLQFIDGLLLIDQARQYGDHFGGASSHLRHGVLGQVLNVRNDDRELFDGHDFDELRQADDGSCSDLVLRIPEQIYELLDQAHIRHLFSEGLSQLRKNLRQRQLDSPGLIFCGSDDNGECLLFVFVLRKDLGDQFQ